MRPVTRLSAMIDYLHSLPTSPLNPVCPLRQTGLFLAGVCMFPYKIYAVLLVFAWLSIANAGEGTITAQAHELASTVARNEQGDKGQNLNLSNGESATARARTSNRQVHSSQFTPGKIASRVAADRGYRSVNAIGARRVEAAAILVQREDHLFYVVRQPSSQNDVDKTVFSNNTLREADTSLRVVEGVRLGNLFMDRSLLLKSATPSRSGHQ